MEENTENTKDETKIPDRTIQDDLDLYDDLKRLNGIDNFDVNYAIGKNIILLKQEVNISKRAQRNITKIAKDFDDEKGKLMEKISGGAMIPDKAGKLNYSIPVEKRAELNVALEALEEKHKEKIAERKKKWEEYFERLDTEASTITLWTLDEDKLPKEEGKRLLTEQFNALLPIIKFK